jgi:hypothetical protein
MPRWVATLRFFCLVPIIVACHESGSDPSTPKASPESRLILGRPAPFLGQKLSDVDAQSLRTSIELRRQFAWNTVATTLASVSIHPGAVNSSAPALLNIPSFETWYGREDFERLFRKLYGDFTADQRRRRDAFSRQSVDAVEDWNVTQVRSLPSWSESRIREFAGQISDEQHANNLAGIGRTRYSSETARHLLSNYKNIEECFKNPDRPIPPDHDPKNRSTCFSSEFPETAAIAKASWRRGDFGLQIPIFDTSAAALEHRLSDGDFSWDVPDRTALPDTSKMLSMVTPQGAHFHMAALHLVTKQLRDWMWITLWYSDNPDTDFGEDRPAFMNQADSPWRNYKMCVVVAYDEVAKIDAEFTGRHPSLAAALTTVNEKSDGASWCSNPYLEMGHRNQQTNCIGCHQHAGTSVDPDKILTDETAFQNRGRTRIRESFPSDYVWSLNKRPENLGELISERIKFHALIDGAVP